jgi:hypothetical protein
MKKWLVVFLILDLAACKVSGTASPVPTEVTPEVTAQAQDAWTRLTAGGVELSIRTPAGWQSVPNDYGILLAEHTEITETQAPDGILVYVFIPVMEDELEFDDDDELNKAYQILDHVTSMPEYIGYSTVSETVAFQWDGHDAAYYLLTDGEGNHTMVIALFLPQAGRMLVCNISSSAQDAYRIREVLPEVLSSLTVNGTAMDAASLAALPNPLPFPEHHAYQHEPRACDRGCAESTSEP